MKRRSRLHLRGLNQTLAYAAVMAAALAAVVLVSGRQFTILERPTGITLPAPTRIDSAPILAAHEGVPVVVDGDTLRMGEHRFRLMGIDAPEIAQSCRHGGAALALGSNARDSLQQLASRSLVQCQPTGRDPYGRWVAVCWAGGVDIGAAQVLAGHALAARKYSDAYVHFEADARRARRGLWACEDFVDPSAFRRSQ